jgi:hypothetical protein
MSVYRRLSAREPHDRAPSELVYEPIVRATERGAYGAILHTVVIPALAGTAVAAVVSASAGLAAAAASCAAVVWWRRRTGGGLVLHVEDGVLHIHERRTHAPRATLRLIDLVDVALDTKSEHLIQEGPSAIPAIAFAESRIGPTIDKARIVLRVAREGMAAAERTFPLSNERGPHHEASEQLGRIRVFLRKNGWVPGDERPHLAEDGDDDGDAEGDENDEVG